MDMALQFTYLFENDPDFINRTWWSDESNVEIGGVALGNTGKPLPRRVLYISFKILL